MHSTNSKTDWGTVLVATFIMFGIATVFTAVLSLTGMVVH